MSLKLLKDSGRYRPVTNWYSDFFGPVVVRPYFVTSPCVSQETPALGPERLDNIARFLGLHATIVVPLVMFNYGHLSSVGCGQWSGVAATRYYSWSFGTSPVRGAKP